MFFSYIKNFISKIIIALLGFGLIISLGVGTDLISFGMSDKVVAEVNKKEVSLEEFNYFRRLKLSQLPKKILSDKEALKIIDKEIINTIARRKVSANHAINLGLHVSKDELKDKIFNTNMFNRNGNFIGFNEYKIKVRDVFGLNVDVFEEILKEEVLTDKLKALFYSFIFVSDSEIEQKFINDSTKFNFYLIKSSNENYKKPIFSDDEVDKLVAIMKEKLKKEDLSYEFVELNYEYLTKDIQITKQDIDSFISNYSSEDEKISPEAVKRLLKKRIAFNKLPEKIEYFNNLSNNKNFKQVIKELDLDDEVKKINFNNIKTNISHDLADQVRNANLSTKVGIFFSNDSIWIFTLSDQSSFTRDEALKMLASENINQYEIELLKRILNDDKNDYDKFESIKGNINYTYDFNYNLSLNEFNRISNFKVPNSMINEGKFVKNVISSTSGNYLIFIEKIRRADIDLLLLDKDKIKKDLSLPRKEKIYGKFLSELFSTSLIKYNKKYID